MQPFTTNKQNTSSEAQNYTLYLIILTALFFIWGFITCLNDILIPHLKSAFSLNYTKAMLIQFSFFTAYFIVSLPAGILLEKIGYQKGIVLGLTTAAIGSALFIPAANLISYEFFLVALFILASGITVLQVAANPYVVVLGKPETSSARLNLTQAFNSLGTTVAPFIGSYLILSVTTNSNSSTESVKLPYLGIALILLFLAIFFSVVKLPKINHTTDEEAEIISETKHKSIFEYKHLIFGVVGIFLYVGAEVSIGSFLVNYFKELVNMEEQNAAKLIAFYWGGAMVGRFIGSFLQNYIKPNLLLAINSLFAASLVILSMIGSGYFSVITILAVGFFNSIMFPTIFSLSLNKLGRFTEKGSGLLCMAIVGGAILPVIQGMFADKIGIHHAFIIPVLCYLYISFFGFKGYKPSI
ncbi:MAG TPA: sugar MFS transporter [Ignavibacteriales bacterium]|nr:sugar MFS transporter [Bacteroidales bacterium]HOJ36845.1 sugar MFS transporter [Ignavibacteriales bacterium]HOL80288.1 sugar MFS transporter [Ignavibacteriales bacterium]HOM64567.1 sugar MFS transporter [Ignavibacteriales bacterium]HPD66664.1 sugar MFS transporter [Ignavibacteriales bacterium]